MAPRPPSTLLNSHLDGVSEYVPIQPLEVLSARLGIPVENLVKLDANENPYGPVPAVREALTSYEYYHIYPDPQQDELRAKLAAQMGVAPGNVLASHGADELLDYLSRLFLAPGDAVVNTPPTFGMYGFDAKLQGAEVVNVFRNPDHSVDCEAIAQAVEERAGRVKLLFLTSPNNPSGSWMDDAALEALLALPVMVVVDEAYIEFADHGGRAEWVERHDNLAVLRTFSKAAGIAGLRLGYGVFPDWLMATLWKFKQPYNVNVAAAVAGLASLAHPGQVAAVVERLKAERARLYAELETLDYLEAVPDSQGNYILCRVAGRDALALKTALEAKGILVRYYASIGLENCIRISVGRPDQTDALITALHAS